MLILLTRLAPVSSFASLRSWVDSVSLEHVCDSRAANPTFDQIPDLPFRARLVLPDVPQQLDFKLTEGR